MTAKEVARRIKEAGIKVLSYEEVDEFELTDGLVQLENNKHIQVG